jgi:hypothetical protein
MKKSTGARRFVQPGAGAMTAFRILISFSVYCNRSAHHSEALCANNGAEARPRGTQVQV